MRHQESHYDDPAQVQGAVQRGDHRRFIGGMWDKIGLLQKSLLVDAGLEPGHTLLDVGCGCLRGGVHFIEYLEPRNYFGVELNNELLEAGYDIELAERQLQDKLPREHLVHDGDFEFSRLPVKFDFAIAISLFTHISFNRIRTSLEKLHPKMNAGGKFYASYFQARSDQPTFLAQKHEKGGVVSFGDKDPFHYHASDLVCAAESLPWNAERIGDWGHPRDQMMMRFTKAE